MSDDQFEDWAKREHPSQGLQTMVREWIDKLEDGVPRDAIRYPNDPRRFEARVPQTKVFVEGFEFEPVGVIDVIRIETGTD